MTTDRQILKEADRKVILADSLVGKEWDAWRVKVQFKADKAWTPELEAAVKAADLARAEFDALPGHESWGPAFGPYPRDRLYS